MKIQLEQLDLLAEWPQMVLRDGYCAIRILARIGSIPIGEVMMRPKRGRMIVQHRLRRRIAREHSQAILQALAQEGISAGATALTWFLPEAWESFSMANADPRQRRAYVEEHILLTSGVPSPLREWAIESQKLPPRWTRPRVTVAICTRDREAILEATIRSVQQLEYPEFDILIVNNSSDPVPTRELAEKLNVSCCRCMIPGSSHAKNTALAFARTEWVAFIDDDCRPERNWLTELVRPLQDEDCRVAIGWTRPARLDSTPEVVLDLHDSRSSKICPANAGSNLLVHRKFALSLDGFDTDLGAGPKSFGAGEADDFVVRARAAGYHVQQAHRALVHHHRTVAPRELRNKMYGRALADAAISARSGAWLRLCCRLPRQLLREIRLAWAGASRFPFSLTLLELKAVVTGPVRLAWMKLARKLGRGAGLGQPTFISPPFVPVASNEPPMPVKPRIAA